MLTRQMVTHDYQGGVPETVNTPGAIQLRPMGAFNARKDIVGAMPIARPNSSPSPEQGAPFYSAGTYQYRPNQLQRGGQMALIPSAPRVEMDPSDKSTWHRPYLFT